MKTSTSNWLRVAHRATPQAEVAFDMPAELIEGHFEATVDLGDRHPEEHRLWVRA
jgi:hypothetical protein